MNTEQDSDLQEDDDDVFELNSDGERNELPDPDTLEHLASTGAADGDGTLEEEVEEEKEKKEEKKDSYTAGVQKRIDKLTKRYRDTEREAQAERARAEALEARIAEIEEKRHEAADKSYEDNETKIKERIKTAVEDEDWAGLTAANEELRELDKKRYTDKLERASKPRQQAPKAEGQAPNIAPEASRWLKENDSWFNEESPDYDAPLARRAMRWSQKLQKDELYDPNDPQLYDAINEKLGLTAGGDDDEEKESPRFVNRGRNRTNIGSRGPRRTSKRGNTISDHDKQVMRVFMLDPDNKEDQAEWIKRRNG